MVGLAYVIVSGEYDSYRVHAVVKGGKRDAEALVARTDAAYRIETIPVVDGDVHQVEIFRVYQELRDDGACGPEHAWTSTEWPFDLLYGTHNVPAGWRWVRAPVHNGRGGRLEVYGTDAGLVKSLLIEMRNQIRVNEKLRKCRERTGLIRPDAPQPEEETK